MKATLALSTSLLLSACYAFEVWLSHDMETCTMGDTDGYFGGLLLGAPAAVAAVFLLRRTSVFAPSQRLLAVGAAVPPLLLLAVLAPWFLSSTVGGHHLCGGQYDSYLGTSRFWERFLPAIHLVLAVAVIGSSIMAYRRMSAMPNTPLQPTRCAGG